MVHDFRSSRFATWCALKFVSATCSGSMFGTQLLADQWAGCKYSNGESHFHIEFVLLYRLLLVYKQPHNKLHGGRSVADLFALIQSGVVATTTMRQSAMDRGKGWRLPAWLLKSHFVVTTCSPIVSVENLQIPMPTTTVLVYGTSLK